MSTDSLQWLQVTWPIKTNIYAEMFLEPQKKERVWLFIRPGFFLIDIALNYLSLYFLIVSVEYAARNGSKHMCICVYISSFSVRFARSELTQQNLINVERSSPDVPKGKPGPLTRQYMSKGKMKC